MFGRRKSDGLLAFGPKSGLEVWPCAMEVVKKEKDRANGVNKVRRRIIVKYSMRESKYPAL